MKEIKPLWVPGKKKEKDVNMNIDQLKPNAESGVAETSRQAVERKAQKCDQCHKSFDTKTGLKVHISKAHRISFLKSQENDEVVAPKLANESILKCEKCNKEFKSISGKNRHKCPQNIDSEISKSKWICEKCGNGFTEKRYMTRHIKQSKKCNNSENT